MNNIRSKYMEFDCVGWTGKTSVYDVLSKSSGYKLGQLKWYGPWRQYCFFPCGETVFNDGCLEDIQRAIRELMAERKRP